MSVASVIKRTLALECFMCTETLENPVGLPCGHTICLACWRAVQTQCPVCGDSSAPLRVAPNEIVAAAVAALGEQNKRPYSQPKLESGDFTTESERVAPGIVKGRVGSKAVAIKTLALSELSPATQSTLQTALGRAHAPVVSCLCPSAACGLCFDEVKSAALLITPFALGSAETLLAKAAENEDATAAATEPEPLPSGLSVEDLVKVALAPARGLAALHARGKVHGNVCARNVLLLPADAATAVGAAGADGDDTDDDTDQNGATAAGGGAGTASLWPTGFEGGRGVQLVLSDAGLREALSSLPGAAGKGTPLAPPSLVYAAPELQHGGAPGGGEGGGGSGGGGSSFPGTPAADVYALGVLLAALSTGRRGKDLKATAAAVGAARGEAGGKGGRAIVSGAVPAALQRLVGGCCDPDPTRRPTAREVTAQLLLLAQTAGKVGAGAPWRLVGMAPSLPALAPGRPFGGEAFDAAVADARAGGYGEHDVVAVAEEPKAPPPKPPPSPSPCRTCGQTPVDGVVAAAAADDDSEAGIWVVREAKAGSALDVVLVHGSTSGRPLRAVALPLAPGCLAVAPDRRLWRVHCRSLAFSPCGRAAFLAVHNELLVDPVLATGSQVHAALLSAARAEAHQVLVLGLNRCSEEELAAAPTATITLQNGERLPLVSLPLLGCLALPVPDGVASSAWGAEKLQALHVHSADVGAGASGGDGGGGCSLLMSRNGRLEQAHFHLAPLLPSGGGGGGGGNACGRARGPPQGCPRRSGPRK